MSYSVSVPVESETHDQMGWAKENHLDALTTELKQFCKCVKGNPIRLMALADIGGISGHNLDPECCAVVSEEVVRKVMGDFVKMMVEGEFKFSGKTGDWSVGFLGNRWLDMNPTPYGVDHIRVSFLSKKYQKGKWSSKHPYVLHIQVEKEK